ncbi:MAG: tetratricopeptide repeat protein [Pontiellaceae bacterium]|nr:tetratricopeptide repeat protein [Pontiellaceae bacterium]MBN2783882.1 tetratricopeptide repeat protein [Pontiellaceae bacterium]
MLRTGIHAGFFVAILLGSGCVWMRDLPYRDQRVAADRAFESQEYVLAAARYEALRDQYPETRIREDLMFRQGVALYSVCSYHGARDVFIDYLSSYPRGSYRADIQDYIKKIDVLMSRSTPAEARKLEEAKAMDNLDVLGRLLAEHPTDWRVLEAIGDVHWKIGNYDEAIDAYYKSQRIASTYEERELNNGKLILDSEGNPVPVNPKILSEMQIKEQPLRVYDLHAYTSRNQENVLGGDLQFYNLTGSLRNQGRQLLRDVEVEVTFRDLGGNILDVDYVSIGSLGPGEVRAFISRADDYDNLYNIVDHDVSVHWRE